RAGGTLRCPARVSRERVRTAAAPLSGRLTLSPAAVPASFRAPGAIGALCLRRRALRRRALRLRGALTAWRLRAPLSALRLRGWPVFLSVLLTIGPLPLSRLGPVGPLFRSVLRAIAA